MISGAEARIVANNKKSLRREGGTMAISIILHQQCAGGLLAHAIVYYIHIKLDTFKSGKTRRSTIGSPRNTRGADCQFELLFHP